MNVFTSVSSKMSVESLEIPSPVNETDSPADKRRKIPRKTRKRINVNRAAIWFQPLVSSDQGSSDTTFIQH